MEKRSSEENVDHNDPSSTLADQAANEQQPEEAVSGDSTAKPADSTANDGANGQPREKAVSGDSTNKPANTTVNESVIGRTQDEPISSASSKNPAAVSLGRLGGLKGGKARAKTLTKRERSNAARKAAMARWRKKKQKN